MAEEISDKSVPDVQKDSIEDNDFQDALEGDESDYISDDSESRSNHEEEGTEEEQKCRALEIKAQGNEKFKDGEYTKACKLYTKAIKCCPKSYPTECSILYNNRATAKLKLEKKESAVKDCTKAITLNPTYVKPLLRRAKLYEELEQLSQALEDYKELDKLEPNNIEVKTALKVLPKRIEEQTEKLKAEMLGKMKDLGNMFLKPFGLSTDNFKINQDPNTGSYSVNMNK